MRRRTKHCFLNTVPYWGSSQIEVDYPPYLISGSTLMNGLFLLLAVVSSSSC